MTFHANRLRVNDKPYDLGKVRWYLSFVVANIVTSVPLSTKNSAIFFCNWKLISEKKKKKKNKKKNSLALFERTWNIASELSLPSYKQLKDHHYSCCWPSQGCISIAIYLNFFALFLRKWMFDAVVFTSLNSFSRCSGRAAFRDWGSYWVPLYLYWIMCEPHFEKKELMTGITLAFPCKLYTSKPQPKISQCVNALPSLSPPPPPDEIYVIWGASNGYSQHIVLLTNKKEINMLGLKSGLSECP